MHYLVVVALESLFQSVLRLTYILLLTSPTGDAVDKIVAVACHVVFSAVFPACNGYHYVTFGVQQWAVTALTVGASLVESFGWFSLLCDRGEFRPYQ